MEIVHHIRLPHLYIIAGMANCLNEFSNTDFEDVLLIVLST